MDYEQLATEAYVVYGVTVDNKNYQGLPMPAWEALPEKIRNAWIATAKYLYEAGYNAANTITK